MDRQTGWIDLRNKTIKKNSRHIFAKYCRERRISILVNVRNTHFTISIQLQFWRVLASCTITDNNNSLNLYWKVKAFCYSWKHPHKGASIRIFVLFFLSIFISHLSEHLWPVLIINWLVNLSWNCTTFNIKPEQIRNINEQFIDPWWKSRQ